MMRYFLITAPVMVYYPILIKKNVFQLSQKLNFTVMFTYQVIQAALHFLDNLAFWSHVLLYLVDCSA